MKFDDTFVYVISYFYRPYWPLILAAASLKLASRFVLGNVWWSCASQLQTWLYWIPKQIPVESTSSWWPKCNPPSCPLSVSLTLSFTHMRYLCWEFADIYTQTKHMRAHYDLPMLVGLLNFTTSTFLWMVWLVADILYSLRTLTRLSSKSLFYCTSFPWEFHGEKPKILQCPYLLVFDYIRFLRNPFDAATCFSLIHFLLMEFNSL